MSLLDTLADDFKPAAQDLYDLALRANVRPRVTSARRSYALQSALYQKYLQGRSRYPAAPPGTSAHEYGYAFDMVVDNATDQADLGYVWRQWGGIYGGEEDPIHYAAPFSIPGAASAGQAPQAPGTDIARTLAPLANVVFAMIPGLSYIVSISYVTTLLWNLAKTYGGGESGAADLILYWLSHPGEFSVFVANVVWTSLKLLF